MLFWDSLSTKLQITPPCLIKTGHRPTISIFSALWEKRKLRSQTLTLPAVWCPELRHFSQFTCPSHSLMFCAHNFAGVFGAVPAHNIVAEQTDDWFQFLDSRKDWVSAPAGILWPKRMLLFWSPPPITHTFSDQGGNGPRNHTYWQFSFCFYKTTKFIASNKQYTIWYLIEGYHLL